MADSLFSGVCDKPNVGAFVVSTERFCAVLLSVMAAGRSEMAVRAKPSRFCVNESGKKGGNANERRAELCHDARLHDSADHQFHVRRAFFSEKADFACFHCFVTFVARKRRLASLRG